jgi:hypothetical protein
MAEGRTAHIVPGGSPEVRRRGIQPAKADYHPKIGPIKMSLKGI